MKSRKIFIGIKMSDEFCAAATRALGPYRDLPVRWISPDDMHLTLIPPWREHDIVAVSNTVEAELAKQGRESISLEFNRIVYGPNPRRPRLIWTEGPHKSDLNIMREHIADVLNLDSEQHPLRPHVTLARFRQEDFKTFPVQNLNIAFAWSESVNEVTLFETVGHGAHRYDVLGRFCLP